MDFWSKWFNPNGVFTPKRQTPLKPKTLKVPKAEVIAAQAIWRVEDKKYKRGYGVPELEIIYECALMRNEGLHSYRLGSNPDGSLRNNIRNRLQRNEARSSLYKHTWGRKYAAIFKRIEGSHPRRWTVVEGFNPFEDKE